MENKVPNFLEIAAKIKNNAARMAATEAQKFFRECFVKGGFTDASFQKWADRKSPLGGRKTLYRDGDLMSSIRKLSESENRISVGSDNNYAQIHNEGGVITVTAQMKKFFWAMYYKFGKKGLKADYFKNLALMKVGTQIKIPQRQFIGESQALMNQLDTWFLNEIETIFKQ